MSDTYIMWSNQFFGPNSAELEGGASTQSTQQQVNDGGNSAGYGGQLSSPGNTDTPIPYVTPTDNIAKPWDEINDNLPLITDESSDAQIENATALSNTVTKSNAQLENLYRQKYGGSGVIEGGGTTTSTYDAQLESLYRQKYGGSGVIEVASEHIKEKNFADESGEEYIQDSVSLFGLNSAELSGGASQVQAGGGSGGSNVRPSKTLFAEGLPVALYIGRLAPSASSGGSGGTSSAPTLSKGVTTKTAPAVDTEYDKSAIFIAHFDDECLQFQPILSKVKAIRICMYAFTSSFDQLKNKFAWKDKLSSIWPNANEKYITPNVTGFYDVPQTNPSQYISRFKQRDSFFLTNSKLENQIRQEIVALKAQGVNTLITHNPWGDYGHLHHTWVFSFVYKVAVELNMVVKITSSIRRSYEDPSIVWQLADALYSIVPATSPDIQFDGATCTQCMVNFNSSFIEGSNADAWTWHDPVQGYNGIFQGIFPQTLKLLTIRTNATDCVLDVQNSKYNLFKQAYKDIIKNITDNGGSELTDLIKQLRSDSPTGDIVAIINYRLHGKFARTDTQIVINPPYMKEQGGYPLTIDFANNTFLNNKFNQYYQTQAEFIAAGGVLTNNLTDYGYEAYMYYYLDNYLTDAATNQSILPAGVTISNKQLILGGQVIHPFGTNNAVAVDYNIVADNTIGTIDFAYNASTDKYMKVTNEFTLAKLPYSIEDIGPFTFNLNSIPNEWHAGLQSVDIPKGKQSIIKLSDVFVQLVLNDPYHLQVDKIYNMNSNCIVFPYIQYSQLAIDF